MTLSEAMVSGTGIERKILSRCVEQDGCWIWTGALTYGYGVVRWMDRIYRTHRVIYGPVPEGLQLDHLCRNRACCNPAHLEAVTHKVNSLRGVGAPAVNAQKTECAAGHPFDEDNTYTDKQGWRYCRKCRARRQREWKAKTCAQ